MKSHSVTMGALEM